MVTIFKENLLRILGNGVHSLFCNEEEALSWASTDRLDVAIAELKDIAQEVYITLGANGSAVIDQVGHQHQAPPKGSGHTSQERSRGQRARKPVR